MILHICTRTVWKEAVLSGEYEGDTLELEGFIHCSELQKVIEVANYVFGGQKDLILLEIDSNKVASEIKYEDPGVGEKYPHIYGPLNIDAVIKIHDFETEKNGSFILPEQLQN